MNRQIGLNILTLVFTAACVLSACTPPGSQNQEPLPSILALAEPPNEEPHVAAIPALEDIIGDNWPGAGHAHHISDGKEAPSIFTATKLVFPLENLDVSKAHGWKQISNGLSLQLLNDLVLVKDDKIRWAIQNFRSDIPFYSTEVNLAELRLEIYKKWQDKLSKFQTRNLGLSPAEVLNLETDILTLQKFLQRETASDDFTKNRFELQSLLFNPIWNVRSSEDPKYLQTTLRELNRTYGKTYYFEMLKRFEQYLASPDMQFVGTEETLEMITKPDNRAALGKTIRQFIEAKVPTDLERVIALNNLDRDIEALGAFVTKHQDAIVAKIKSEKRQRNESALTLKYLTTGIKVSPTQMLKFGENALQSINLEIAAVKDQPAHLAFKDQHTFPVEDLKIDSGEKMLAQFASVSRRIDKLLNDKQIITVPTEELALNECNVPGYPYRDKKRFCSNKVPSMSANNYLANYPVSQGESKPSVTFPVYEYLAKEAPQFLSLNTTIPILAHEARPGHELQFRGLGHGQSTLARAFFANHRTSTEGWALYAELLVQEAMGDIDKEMKLEFLKLRKWRVARVIVENRLYTQNMSEEEAVDFLVQEVGLDRATAADEVKVRYLDPEFPSDASYYYGFSQLVELRERIKAEMGEGYNAKAFNDAVVKLAFLPIDDLYPLVKLELTGQITP